MLPYGNKSLPSRAYGKLAMHGKTLKGKIWKQEMPCIAHTTA